tara:strand:- start:332 stop:889 length:558 start_codon:yes stop_codon:yes gene_type:complete
MLNNEKIFNLILLLGAFVPVSYYLTYKTFKSRIPINKLWGNVDTGLQGFYKLSMLLCVVGMFAVLFFITMSIDNDTKIMNKKYLNGGMDYITQSLALIVIPSLVWMPLSYMYLIKPSLLLKIAIVVTLTTVGLGGLLLAHTIKNTNPTKMINRNLTYKSMAVVGANYLAFHLIFLDAIYWTYSFF